MGQGDLTIPIFIRATVPPDVETKKRLKSEMTYNAQYTRASRGRVCPFMNGAESTRSNSDFDVRRHGDIRDSVRSDRAVGSDRGGQRRGHRAAIVLALLFRRRFISSLTAG
jgi:hypothetical protein